MLRHAALDKPKTEFEKTVAAFDERLARLRSESDDVDEPSNWLTPAGAADIEAIKKKWRKLPKNYLDFLTRFSPLNVRVPEGDEEFAREIELFGASELIDGQAGYSVHARTGKPIESWPQEYVVVGHMEGDPFVLDLSNSDGRDAPIVTAEHGQGEWSFYAAADSFQEFLRALTEPGEPDEDDIEEEIENLTRKIRNTPDRAELYVNRGECLVSIDEYERAVRDFDAAIERGVESSAVFEGRGNAYFGLDRMEEAIDDYTRALKLMKTAEAFSNRGRAYAELDRYQEAIADLTEAIELDPDDGDNWYYRGEAYRALWDCVRSEADFTQAIDLSEGDEEWLDTCYLYRGGIRCDANRTDEALADLNRSLELDPESDAAFMFRGNTHMRMKEYRKALADYERGLELAPNDGYNLGVTAWFLATCPDGRFRDGKRALKLATRAVEKSGGKDHLDSLAAAQAERGKFVEAVKTQKEAIRLCGNPRELQRLQRALKDYEAGEAFRDNPSQEMLVAGDIYLDSVSPSGLHQCIIEGDSRTVWMYLHDLESRSVIADAPICSLVELMPLAEFKASYRGEGAPPLVVEYACERSVIPNMTIERLRIEWQSDDISVLAYVDDEPFTMIVAGERKGYSKAMKVAGPWGKPWDDEALNSRLG